MSEDTSGYLKGKFNGPEKIVWKKVTDFHRSVSAEFSLVAKSVSLQYVHDLGENSCWEEDS